MLRILIAVSDIRSTHRQVATKSDRSESPTGESGKDL